MKISTLGEQAEIVAKHRRTDTGKLSQLLRGELDWIVMKALEKERDRRYETANSFARDVERYLADETVEACPPSTVYRLKKVFRRHKQLVGACAALVIVLLIGIAGTSWGLVRAEGARRVAVAERSRAEAEKDEKEDALIREEKARLEAVQLNYNMAFDRGQALCDEGHIGRGMLWLARALELAPSNEKDMRRVILANLNAWRRELHWLRAILSHDQMVVSAVFTPDGNRILTGSADTKAQLWDLEGRRIGEPMLHNGDVHEIAFNPDGSRFLTGNYDNTARLWVTETGELLHMVRHQSLVPAAAFAPNGLWFVTGNGNGDVTISDAATGELIGDPLKHGHMVHDLAISSDGTQIVTACHDGNVRVWDVDTRQEPIATFYHGTGARVTSVDFRRPECKQIVSGDMDGDAYLWDVAAAANDADKKLEVKAKEFIGGPWQHRGVIHRLRVSPDGSRILTASIDNTARLWDPDQDEEVSAAFEHRGAVQGVAFSPDGSLVVTTSEDNAARLWRPAIGNKPVDILEHTGVENHEAVFTSDGRYLLTKAERETAIHESDTGARLCVLLGQSGGVRSVAVNTDATKILVGGAAGGRLWDATTGKLIDQPFHAGAVWATAFSPDGTRMLTGAFDGSLQVREVHTGKLLDELQLGGRIYAVAFSPEGSRFVAMCSDKMIHLIDTNTGIVPRAIPGHRSSVTCAAFSADGSRIVTGSFDNTARVWDASTGNPVTDAMSHESPIWTAVGFSPNGRAVVTGCDDGTVRIWDLTTAKPIGPALAHEAAVRMVTFSSDSQVRTGTNVGTVRLWQVSTSPLEDDVQRINLWVQVATGFELDSDGTTNVLDAQSWQRRRARLDKLGGPPL